MLIAIGEEQVGAEGKLRGGIVKKWDKLRPRLMRDGRRLLTASKIAARKMAIQ